MLRFLFCIKKSRDLQISIVRFISIHFSYLKFLYMGPRGLPFLSRERDRYLKNYFLIHFRNLPFSKINHFMDIPISLPWLEAVHLSAIQLAKDSVTLTQAIAGNQCKSSISYCSRGPQVS